MNKTVVLTLLAFLFLGLTVLTAKKINKPELLWKTEFGSNINSISMTSDASRVAVITKPILFLNTVGLSKNKVCFLDSEGKILWDYEYVREKGMTERYELSDIGIDEKNKLIRCKLDTINIAEKKNINQNYCSYIYLDYTGKFIKQENEVKRIPSDSQVEQSGGKKIFFTDKYRIYEKDPDKKSKPGCGIYDAKTGELVFFVPSKYNCYVNSVYFCDKNNLFIHLNSYSNNTLVLVDIAERRIKWEMKIRLKQSEVVVINTVPGAKYFCLGLDDILNYYKNTD